jgi:glutaredoxin-related protein
MPYVQVWVEVENNIEDFTDAQLVTELERRNKSIPGSVDLESRLQNLYHVVRMNDKEAVFEASKSLVCDALGRCA